MIEPLYLKGSQTQEEEAQDQLVKDCSDVDQTDGEMLKFMKAVSKGTQACVPKVGKLID